MARLKEGWSKNMVIASYCRAMAERVAALLKRLGVEKEFIITGGISKNIGVVKRIEKIIGVTALKPSLDTQIAGALGAALFAWDLHRKSLER
jgi:benzoyl-CoA reductase subunit A